MAALGGGYWYWKQAQAGANIKAPSNSGLKAYWKFDETAGTSATDSSGNNNTGTLQSSPSRVEGKKNKAITFNGSNQYVSVPDSTSINIGTAVTVSAWVKGDSWADGDTNAVYIKYLSHYVTVNTSGNVGVYGYGKSPVGYHHSNQALKTGIWYNIAVTIDASEFRIYIDGKLDKTVSATGTLSTSAGQAAAIGAEPGGGSRYFNGSIDEVRIYNRALPMEEIASSYAETKIDYSFENSLEQGLVGYWKLDDASGTSAADSSGNGNTGTLTSGPTWTTGQIGGATDFDGTDDYITVPDGNSLDLTSDITISVWAKADNWTGEGAAAVSTLVKKDLNYILRKDTDATTGGSGLKLYWWDGTNKITQSITTLPTTGVWHHIVGVIESNSTRKIYVDGALQSGTNYSAGSARVLTTNLSIGNHQSASDESFDGSMDEVRIYNRALSADEVTKLYRQTAPDNPDTGLVGYWSFNGKDLSGTTAYDRSGKGNNGTLTNGPTKTIGKSGQALSFNGTNSSVDIPDSTSLSPTTALTYSFWTKRTDNFVSGTKPLVAKSDGGGGRRGTAVKSNANGAIDFCATLDSNNDNCFSTAATGVIRQNEWAYVTAVFYGAGATNADRLKVYVNGVQQAMSFGAGTVPATVTDTIAPVNIGGNGTYFWLSGIIDEVRMYNRALSASEIWDLYQAGAADKVNSADSQGDSLEKGMVGYWKLDDASGTSAADASGNGNTGTLTNGPTWTTGQIGGATSFDGTNQYISIPESSSLRPSSMTISAWVNSSTTSSVDTITKIGDYGLRVSAGKFEGFIWGCNVVGTTTFSTGTWYLVTYVYTSGGSGKLYVNGVAEGAACTGDGRSAGSPLEIGRRSGFTYFPGSLDEVRIYNRALSAEEVTKLYKTTAPDDPDTGLVGYWPFNGKDISGTTAYDRSGKGNNGTLTNGPTKTIGKSGQALDFDGADDYASVADNATLDFTASADFAISGWVYRDTSTTDDTILAKRNGIANTDDGYIAYIDDVDDRLHVEVSDNADTDEFELVSNSTFTTPGWNHFAVVWDDDSTVNTEIYINGVADSATETGTQGNIGDLSNALTLRVGAESDNGNPFDGKLDEIRVYNRALSATEIKDQYDQGGRIGWICGNGTVTDADNNIYGTIQIGTQCWMKQNMRVGTRIAASTNQTNNGTTEKYCYSNTDSNCTSANPNQPDGGLYQWNEAMQYSTIAGARGICPAGWHIPTDAEQYTLENYLKDAGQTCNASRSGTYGCFTAGTKLKPGGTSGFEGNLAGFAYAGSFYDRGSFGHFWSSSESGATAWCRSLLSASATVNRNAFDKSLAFSVRCAKD